MIAQLWSWPSERVASLSLRGRQPTTRSHRGLHVWFSAVGGMFTTEEQDREKVTHTATQCDKGTLCFSFPSTYWCDNMWCHRSGHGSGNGISWRSYWVRGLLLLCRKGTLSLHFSLNFCITRPVHVVVGCCSEVQLVQGRSSSSVSFTHMHSCILHLLGTPSLYLLLPRP